MPLGVTVEDYSHVKKRVDALREQGVHDVGAYLEENPDDRRAMVRSVQVLDANTSMLKLYQVGSFRDYMGLYDGVTDWENTGWADSYTQIINDLAQNSSCFGEYLDVSTDGARIHVGFVSWVLNGHENDWSRVVTTHEDITERKRSEKRVSESEARLMALFDNASEGMFFKDMDGRYEMVNKTFANRIGFDDVSEVIGKTVFDLFPEDDAEKYRLDDITCMESRQISSRKLFIPLPNGAELVQFAIKFPIISEGDNVVGIGGIDVDITERERLDRMKDEFVSTVSHELRTPLTSMKGALGLLKEGVLEEMPDKASSMLEIAYKNTNRLINLVNDVLDMEKIVSGGMEYDFQSLDIAALVEDALEADHEFMAEYGERTIVTDIASAIEVHCDATRLTQVVTNLLSNAIKFSPEGGEVKVTVSRCDGGVMVSITDHGEGIPEKYKDHIFERFTQVDGSDSRQKGGTGLGLNISRSIIEKHGGSIGFESEPGAGSTFYFILPVLD